MKNIKKIMTLLLTLVVFSSMVSNIFAATTTQKLDNSIVLIGDSNTWRLGQSCPDLYHHVTFICRRGATVTECVQNNNQIADYSTKTMYQLCHDLHGAKTIIINLGTNHIGNNSTQSWEIRLKEYKKNYQKLIQKLQINNPNAKIYLCRILPVNKSSKYDNQRVVDINGVVEQMANTNHLTVIDYNGLFSGKDVFL